MEMNMERLTKGLRIQIALRMESQAMLACLADPEYLPYVGLEILKRRTNIRFIRRIWMFMAAQRYQTLYEAFMIRRAESLEVASDFLCEVEEYREHFGIQGFPMSTIRTLTNRLFEFHIRIINRPSERQDVYQTYMRVLSRMRVDETLVKTINRLLGDGIQFYDDANTIRLWMGKETLSHISYQDVLCQSAIVRKILQ